MLRLATSGTATAPPASGQAVGDLLEAVEHRWQGVLARDGRRLAVVWEPASAHLSVPGRTTDQILDVLLADAHRHGAGSVSVSLRDMGSALALDVTDEGTAGLDARAIFERGTGDGSGIGLALAREMTEAAGARLSLSGTAPTRFTLLLPMDGEGSSARPGQAGPRAQAVFRLRLAPPAP
ncbi:ATP-binding protein [Streptomyces lavendulae]|uniref:ATP-binding protein n=1 Tax=Streptomyces lavendulae TaxID=1914 RepID=UPI0036EEB40E